MKLPALYHCIFLLAVRPGDEAKEYIEIAGKHPMLPEEKALLDRGGHGVSERNPPNPESARTREGNIDELARTVEAVTEISA